MFLKEETPHRKVKDVVLAGVKAREQAEVTAEVKEKAEELDKAAVTDGNHSIQNKNH